MPTEDNPPSASPSESASTTLDPTRQATKTELTGQVLSGRYLIQRELKRGGMGVVYLAADRQLHSRPVVVKVLLDAAYQSEYVVQKFRQEIEALSRIDHPGIVGIVDAGELQNGRPFIVMQYVEGVTLRSVMNQEGMNLERIAGLLKVVSRALAAAHSRGIFHRDLKPDNIMLQDLGHGDEQVKIIDFGIAKVKNSVIAPSTAVNLSPGTVAYMAPEQLNGRPITAATDIFALGAIAYEMVTGRKPFNPETGFELLQLQQAGVRVKPVDLRPSLPLKAQDVILKALSYNPGDRQSTPREFGDQLAQAMVPDNLRGELPSGSPIELPATELSSEVTPLARVAAVAPPDHIEAALPPARPVDLSAARRDSSERSVGKRRPRSWFGLLGGAGLIIAAIAVFTIWYLGRSRTEGTPPADTDRVMNYGLTVQKVRSGQPYQEPFESSGQEIFENGWKFRISFTSPQPGYLYFLNEGPDVGGKVTYKMLFPAPSTNDGSPKVEAEQKIQTGWMVFDEHQGTEKFWMVWSEQPVTELEAVKVVVNPNDKGTISDPERLNAVRQFLDQHSSPKPNVEKSKTKKETQVKGKGEVLAHLMELEHH